MANDDVSLDDIDEIDDTNDDWDGDDNVSLEADDDVGEAAEEMGVIDDEDDEVDITRVPFQSDITHSPPPERGMPDLDEDDDEFDEASDVTDLETEVELAEE